MNHPLAEQVDAITKIIDEKLKATIVKGNGAPGGLGPQLNAIGRYVETMTLLDMLLDRKAERSPAVQAMEVDCLALVDLLNKHLDRPMDAEYPVEQLEEREADRSIIQMINFTMAGMLAQLDAVEYARARATRANEINNNFAKGT